MMRRGINPKGASPARRRSERRSAGRIEVTNSCQGDDQATNSLGVVEPPFGHPDFDDVLFEFERFDHACGTLPSFPSLISILSPTSVLVSAAVRHGSSKTEAARLRTGAKRQGGKSPWM